MKKHQYLLYIILDAYGLSVTYTLHVNYLDSLLELTLETQHF